MPPWHEFWSGGFWAFPIIMMAFMLVMVTVILVLVRSLWGRDFQWHCTNRQERRYGESDSPLELAKSRYARGEITREEFEEIRTTIG
jgi:putative membrane protein